MPSQKEKQDMERLFPKQEYVGNIWGWRNSFISLGIIVFFAGLMYYRHHYVEPLEQSQDLFPNPDRVIEPAAKDDENNTDTLKIK